MKALVLGASGQMGRAVAATLLDAGWEVDAATGSNRPLPAGLSERGARRLPTGSLTTMLGDGADLLFDPHCMTAADAAIRSAIAPHVGHMVVISTASVYADDQGRGFETPDDFPDYGGPLSEDRATVPPGPGYSAEKVAMEHHFRDAGHSVTLLRPGAIHGTGAQHPREWVVVKRLLDGRPRFPVQGAGDNLFQTTAAENIARATLACVTARLTGPVNVGDPDPPRLRDIVASIAAHMGRDIALIPVTPPETDAHVGATPWSVPRPVILDCARLGSTGWAPLIYTAALPPYIDWLVSAGADDWRAAFPGFARYPYDPFDYEAEDRCLSPL